MIAAREIAPLFAPRPAESNKGSYGHVLVIGGSLGKSGAAAMAGISALRVGAGLSTVATPKSVLPTVAGFHPEIMTEPLAETEAGTIARQALGKLSELAKGKTVLAVGPGISRNPETSEFVRTLVRDHEGAILSSTRTASMPLKASLNSMDGINRWSLRRIPEKWRG